MFMRGGEQWQRYNAITRDQVLANQAADGSWKAPNNGETVRTLAGLLETDVTFRTCLAILMLEVYYRHVPTAMPHGKPPVLKPPGG
jgi:hypothetical protein